MRSISIIRGSIPILALVTLVLLAVEIKYYSRNALGEPFFDQHSDRIEIALPYGVDVIGIASIVPPPREIDQNILMWLESNGSQTNVENGKAIVATLDEPRDVEYSIFVFWENPASDDLEYLEFVRQSEVYLREKFGYERENGYTILGRRTVGVPEVQVPFNFTKRIFDGKPEYLDVQVLPVSKYKEINVAVAVMNFLYGNLELSGPTNIGYDGFLSLPFEEKMTKLTNGEYSVQCQAFRDVFLHALKYYDGLRMRGVELLNFRSNSDELITYGHSTAEIWIDELGKWILFDPWLGLSVKSDGILLSASEIKSLKDYPESLELVPYVEEIPRHFSGANGLQSMYVFRPPRYSLTDFFCTEHGCAPGYLSYFNHVGVRK